MRSLFITLFAISMIAFSCNNTNDQVVKPAKSVSSSIDVPSKFQPGGRIAESGCTHPDNLIVMGQYYAGGPLTSSWINKNNTTVYPSGATEFQVDYHNDSYQYFETWVKVDKISGPGTYSEGWRLVHLVNTAPIYQSSAIQYISQSPIADDGSVYQATFQTRAFNPNYSDCYSVETVHIVQWTEDGTNGNGTVIRRN